MREVLKVLVGSRAHEYVYMVNLRFTREQIYKVCRKCKYYPGNGG